MKIAVIVLTILLILSNVFWIYQVIDTGVTLSYRDQQVYELEGTRKQLMATFPVVAQNETKAQVIAAASQFTDQPEFEKEGCTWVGWLGFQFDAQGKLSTVSPAWSVDDRDPCFKS